MDLRKDLIKLAYQKPEYRKVLLPLVQPHRVASDQNLVLFKQTTRLAYVTPHLRPELLPLLKKHAGVLRDIKKFFSGDATEIDKLDKKLEKGKDLSEDTIQKLTDDLMQSAMADATKDAGKEVSKELTYTPDKADLDWFLKNKGKEIEYPDYSGASAFHNFRKIFEGTALGAAESAKRNDVFWEVVRNVRKVGLPLLSNLIDRGTTKLKEEYNKVIDKTFPEFLKKTVKLKIHPGEARRLFDRMKRTWVDLPTMERRIHGSRQKSEKGPLADLWYDDPKVWRKIRDQERKYYTAVVSHHMENELNETRRGERRFEESSSAALKKHKKELATFAKEQITRALKGEPPLEPSEIEDKTFNENNILATLKNGILKNMEGVTEDLNKAFEKYPEAREKLTQQFEKTSPQETFDKEIPKITGSVGKPSTKKVVNEKFIFGLVPRTNTLDIEGIAKGRYEHTAVHKKEEPKPKPEPKKTHSRATFLKEHRGKKMYMPSVKEERAYSTLAGSEEPEDQEAFDKAFGQWQDKFDKAACDHSALKQAVIKLAYEHQELRPDLLPVIFTAPGLTPPNDSTWMKQKIDDAIQNGDTEPRVLTMRYGGPLRTRRDYGTPGYEKS